MSKKMTKGTVAIAAGVVLLLGGAGTYALWEVNQPLTGTVQTGDLNLELGSAAWTLNGNSVTNVNEVRIVPGDELVLTQDLTVTAIGDDLIAQLSIDATAAVPAELQGHLDISFDLPARPEWAQADAEVPNTYTVEPSNSAYDPVPATVTIAFDQDTPGRDGVTQAVDLTAVNFELAQVAN